MKRKAKEIFIIVALILFLIPGLFAICSGVRRAVEISNDPHYENPDATFVKEYPFTVADSDRTAADGSNWLNQYLTKEEKLTGFIEHYSGSSSMIAPPFLYVYGKIENALGKNVIDDTEQPVVKLDNGYLTFAYLSSQGSADYTAILDFHDWLTQRGIPFLFILPAEKSDSRYAVYPKGYPQGQTETLDKYLKCLEDNGISCLDSTETLVSENKDFYSWFYKTDHHWNVHAGFSIAKAIAQRLKTAFSLPVEPDILDKTQFDTVLYEDLFLGSQGKKATLGYTSSEDFEVYYPLFATSFSIEIPSRKIEQTGLFESTLIDALSLKAGNAYVNGAYPAFLYGDVPLARIHNLTCSNGTRALMIKTSDANVVDTYLAFTVEYLDIIDPRHFDGSIKAFIEATDPDVVMTCTYPSEALDQKMLDIK